MNEKSLVSSPSCFSSALAMSIRSGPNGDVQLTPMPTERRGLAELPIIGNIDRIEVLTPQGKPRTGERNGRVIFGPTCDSVDRLPGELTLPDDIAEDDYVIFHGAGAYSVVTNTRFNGFGAMTRATVMGFE